MTSARRTLELAISEDDLLNQIVALSMMLGWLVYHARSARTAKGWRTPLSGHAGFPDLVLVKNRTVFAELKTETGRLTDGQRRWISVLRKAGADVHIWRPSDWPTIEQLLRSS